LLQKTALLTVTLLISVAILEFGVLILLGEQPKFPRHVVGGPAGVRINEPNAEYRHKSADVTVRFRINSQGMRADRDFVIEKPAGVKRILSLGDSFTVGYEVEAEDTFSSVLGEELTKRGHRVEVLNAGVSGFSNAEALLSLERDLYRYTPDIVLISFYGNDLVDNVRSGLFRLDGDQLVQISERYVPLGTLGNFLNTNAFFNGLSGYSNAFVAIKERITLLLKADLVKQNVDNLERAEDERGGPSYEQNLTVAIFERFYEFCQKRDIKLVIHSIPSLDLHGLVELFPIDRFDADRGGILFVPSREILLPYLESSDEQLYWNRSHGHWTPFSHRVAGGAMARAILESKWLDNARDASADEPTAIGVVPIRAAPKWPGTGSAMDRLASDSASIPGA
jgi:hypothetical protein